MDTYIFDVHTLVSHRVAVQAADEEEASQLVGSMSTGDLDAAVSGEHTEHDTYLVRAQLGRRNTRRECYGIIPVDLMFDDVVG